MPVLVERACVSLERRHLWRAVYLGSIDVQIAGALYLCALHSRLLSSSPSVSGPSSRLLSVVPVLPPSRPSPPFSSSTSSSSPLAPPLPISAPAPAPLVLREEHVADTTPPPAARRGGLGGAPEAASAAAGARVSVPGAPDGLRSFCSIARTFRLSKSDSGEAREVGVDDLDSCS